MKNKILKLIEKEIELQKNLLVGEFEKDKSIQWKIIGLQYILYKIELIKDEK